MKKATIKIVISWIGLLLAIVSVAALACLKLVFSWANWDTSGPKLFSIYFFGGILAGACAVFTIRSWQSIVALALVCVDIYFFLFAPPSLWIA